MAIFLYAGISYLNEYVQSSYLYLIISMVTLFVIRKRVKKASIDVEQLTVFDNYIKLSFFNKNKNRVTLNLSDIKINVIDDELLSISKDDVFLGRINKNYMEKVEKWEELKQLLIEN